MKAQDELRWDIQAAVDRMKQARLKLGWGAKTTIKRLTRHLMPYERVDQILPGQYLDTGGLLVLTDKRLLFVKDGKLGGISEDFPFGSISSIGFQRGIRASVITIANPGNTAQIQWVDTEEARELVSTARSRLRAGTGE